MPTTSVQPARPDQRDHQERTVTTVSPARTAKMAPTPKTLKWNIRHSKAASTAHTAPWARPALPAELALEECPDLKARRRCLDATRHPDLPERWDHLVRLAVTARRDNPDHQAMTPLLRLAFLALRDRQVHKAHRDQTVMLVRTQHPAHPAHQAAQVTQAIKALLVSKDPPAPPESPELQAKTPNTALAHTAGASSRRLPPYSVTITSESATIAKRLPLPSPPVTINYFDYHCNQNTSAEEYFNKVRMLRLVPLH